MQALQNPSEAILCRADGLVSVRFHHLLIDYLSHANASLQLPDAAAPAAVQTAAMQLAGHVTGQESARAQAAGWRQRLPVVLVTLYGRPPAIASDCVASWQLAHAAQRSWYQQAASLLAFGAAAPGAHFAAAAFPVEGAQQRLHTPAANGERATRDCNASKCVTSSAAQAAATVLELVVMHMLHGSRPSSSALHVASERLLQVPACVMPTVQLLQALQSAGDRAGAQEVAQQQHRNLSVLTPIFRLSLQCCETIVKRKNISKFPSHCERDQVYNLSLDSNSVTSSSQRPHDKSMLHGQDVMLSRQSFRQRSSSPRLDFDISLTALSVTMPFHPNVSSPFSASRQASSTPFCSSCA